MSIDRPRLLLVSPLPPPAGGIATWTRLVAGSELAERFAIRVLDTSPRAKDTVRAVSRFRLDRALEAVRLLLQLVVELVRFRPGLVHVNTSYQWALYRDGIFVLLARAAGARTLLHFRGGDFPEMFRSRPRPIRRAIRFVLSRCDRLLALDRHTQTFLSEEFGPQRVRYLPNFVRLDEFVPGARRARPLEAPLEVLYVGWILEAKGIRELLVAVRTLDRVNLTLVGPTEPAFVETLGPELAALGDRVRLLPSQTHARIRELYADADVFVLPSWREGFPNVVLEAMATGLPVVATPVGAIPDAVRHEKEGVLVPPRDASALRAALERLHREPDAREVLGRNARARVEEEFAMEAVLRRLARIYAELVAERTSPTTRGLSR